MKFQDLYVAFLEEQTQRGGSEDKVAKMFEEYNHPTEEGFAKWASVTLAVPCETCGIRFKMERITPNQEVLCPDCRKS